MGAAPPQSCRSASTRAPAPFTRVVRRRGESGLPGDDDGTGEVTEGVPWTDKNFVDGRRHSAADAYLRPILDWPNSAIVTDAHVSRLDLIGHVAAERITPSVVESRGPQPKRPPDVLDQPYFNRPLPLTNGAPKILLRGNTGRDADLQIGFAPLMLGPRWWIRPEKRRLARRRRFDTPLTHLTQTVAFERSLPTTWSNQRPCS